MSSGYEADIVELYKRLDRIGRWLMLAMIANMVTIVGLVVLLASLASCAVDTTELAKPIRICNLEGNIEQREACVCRHLEIGDCYLLKLDAITVCMPDPDPAHSITEFPADAVFCDEETP